MSNELLEKLLVTGAYKHIVGELLQTVLSLGKLNFATCFEPVCEELYLGAKVSNG